MHIGCQQVSVEQAILLHNHCTRFYSRMSEASFFLAFELNASNQLAKRHDHFNSFDIHFIGSVMQAYNDYEREVNKEITKGRDKEPSEVKLLEGKGMADLYAQHVEWFKKDITLQADIAGVAMYNWLEREGMLLNPSDNLIDYWNKQSKVKAREMMKLSTTRIQILKEQKSHEYNEYIHACICEKKRMYYLWHLKQVTT